MGRGKESKYKFLKAKEKTSKKGRRGNQTIFLKKGKKIARILKIFKFKLTSYVSGTYFLEVLSAGSVSKTNNHLIKLSLFQKISCLL